MTRRIKSCAFTGYRPQKMPWGFNEDDPRCEDFKHRLKDMILVMILEGYRHFISGAAMGTDLWGAQYILEFKKEFPDLTLDMAIPFEGQAEKWSYEYRNLRDSVMRSADKITLISRNYTRNCMFDRNRYMVQNADAVIAAYDGQEGGTKMTVEMARRMSVPVVLVPPTKSSISKTA